MALTLIVAVERWPIAGSFVISRGAKTKAVVVVAELSDGRVTGRPRQPRKGGRRKLRLRRCGGREQHDGQDDSQVRLPQQLCCT